jgi:hypothetical protein
MTIACVQLRPPSLPSIALACALTVPRAMFSSDAITLFGRSLAINRRILLSRMVNGVRVKLFFATRDVSTSQR